MTTPASFMSQPVRTGAMFGLSGALVGIGIGMIALGAVFRQEAAAAVHTWEVSTAYNHCFLVIPIVLWLIYDRRDTLRGVAADPLPVAALLALPIGAAWLLAERLGIMEGRQLLALSVAEVLFLAVLGWRLWRALCGPLLYLYFLVPFGEFLVPTLQDITAAFIRHGLPVLGIPAYVDGYTIEIPEGTFYVAEACAGLRFLIASIAFGVLYALMMYRSPIRRATFILVSIVVPVIANGFRALGIVVLGHVLNSAEAAAADHVVYGWVFFSVVVLLLIVLGLPFREDSRPAPVAASEPQAPQACPRAALVAASAVLAVSILAPAAAATLNRAGVPPDLPAVPFDVSPSCLSAPAAAPPLATSLARASMQRVTCGGQALDIVTIAFSPRATSGPVFSERRRLSRPPTGDDVTDVPLPPSEPGAPIWRLVLSQEPFSIAAVGLWVDGTPAAPGFATRLHMARQSLLGGQASPLLVVVRPAGDPAAAPSEQRQGAEQALMTFMQSHPDLAMQARALSATQR